ncbi:hypothetical protein ACSS6W_007259 [Trichoderma asperelloides]
MSIYVTIVGAFYSKSSLVALIIAPPSTRAGKVGGNYSLMQWIKKAKAKAFGIIPRLDDCTELEIGDFLFRHLSG